MYRILILAVLIVSGCALVGTDSQNTFEEIRISSNRSVSIFVWPVEETASYLIDPVPSFKTRESPFPEIEPGKSLAFSLDEIENYSDNANIVLYVYTVDGRFMGPEEVASFSDLIGVSNEELQSSRGLIEIE